VVVGCVVVGCVLVGSVLVGCVLVGSFLVGSFMVRSLLVGCFVVRCLLVGCVVVGCVVVGSFLVGCFMVRRLLVGDLLVVSRPTLSGTAKVWWLCVAIALAGSGFVIWVGTLAPLDGAPFTIPWWVLVVLFYIAERTVVHFSFNRHAHSFSLSEIPLVLGLFFASPLAVLAGQAIGSMAALALHRRQSPQKLVFNVTQFTLQAGVAVLVFRSLAGGADPLGFRAAFAALLAVGAALVLANLLINAAIRLSGGRMTRADMLQVLSLGGAAASMNTALALIAVHVAWARPSALWIALIPPLLLFVAYRAQVNQRQEHARLAAMYDATRELHRTPRLDEAVLAATRRARGMFGAARGEIVLFQGEEGIFSTAVENGSEQVMDLVETSALHPLLLEVVETGSSRIEQTDPDRRRNDVMVVPLRTGDEVIGAFIVGEPESDIGSFSQSDLALLETLASQLSVSLENGRLEESLAALHHLKEELRYQAEHDPLTGLANRALFRRLLAEAIERTNDRSAVLFLDLDDFKRVNDTFGHAAGDELLRLVAGRIQACCRTGDVVARLGGDEFAVLLGAIDSPGRESTVAARLLAAFERPFDIDGQPVFARASIGVAAIAATDSVDSVLAHADEAMYVAKHGRKGSFHLHGQDADRVVRRRSELRADLQTALVSDGLDLHYQPIVDLETGDSIGVEALLRWTHPVHGAIPVPEALAVADEAGLMQMLGTWTISRACRDIAEIRRLDPSLWVSVNISADQVHPGLASTVVAELDAYGLDPSALVIEITETAAIEYGERLLADVAELGVRIAIDDFGTGYSSLSRLDSLPISIVKVDRSFVARMSSPERSRLAEMVVEIGQTLGLMTIAEGIENEETRQHLLGLGCDVGQGWLFAAAMPTDEIAARVRAQLAG
ncbi:MAG: putative bifunctional diguanylate cyclase/phosphodiesterase, partial [Acidimicrobiia bacterium]